MLRRLRQHRLVRAGAEILADIVLYFAAVLIVIVILGQLVRLGRSGPDLPDGWRAMKGAEVPGADLEIERAWRDGLKPDPLLTVSKWADQYRVLSQRASSELGRWRTERTRYLREIMD